MGWYQRQDIAIKYPPLKVKIQLLRRIVFYTEGRDRVAIERKRELKYIKMIKNNNARKVK